jgi:hypothetical protein
LGIRLDRPTDIFFVLQEKVYTVCNAEADTTYLGRMKEEFRPRELMTYFDGILAGANGFFVLVNGGDC